MPAASTKLAYRAATYAESLPNLLPSIADDAIFRNGTAHVMPAVTGNVRKGFVAKLFVGA